MNLEQLSKIVNNIISSDCNIRKVDLFIYFEAHDCVPGGTCIHITSPSTEKFCEEC